MDLDHFEYPEPYLVGLMATHETHQIHDAGDGIRYAYDQRGDFVARFRVIPLADGGWTLDPDLPRTEIGEAWARHGSGVRLRSLTWQALRACFEASLAIVQNDDAPRGRGSARRRGDFAWLG